jgi:hypothetical protein
MVDAEHGTRSHTWGLELSLESLEERGTDHHWRETAAQASKVPTQRPVVAVAGWSRTALVLQWEPVPHAQSYAVSVGWVEALPAEPCDAAGGMGRCRLLLVNVTEPQLIQVAPPAHLSPVCDSPCCMCSPLPPARACDQSTPPPAGYHQLWGTPSCREAAPLTPHAQPGTTSCGVPPAVERQLHLHHTPSRVPPAVGTPSCREAASLTYLASPV